MILKNISLLHGNDLKFIESIDVKISKIQSENKFFKRKNI